MEDEYLQFCSQDPVGHHMEQKENTHVVFRKLIKFIASIGNRKRNGKRKAQEKSFNSHLLLGVAESSLSELFSSITWLPSACSGIEGASFTEPEFVGFCSLGSV